MLRTVVLVLLFLAGCNPRQPINISASGGGATVNAFFFPDSVNVRSSKAHRGIVEAIDTSHNEQSAQCFVFDSAWVEVSADSVAFCVGYRKEDCARLP